MNNVWLYMCVLTCFEVVHNFNKHVITLIIVYMYIE